MLWSYVAGGQSSPAVANGAVFIGSGNSVYALDATSGTLQWSYATGSTIESSPAVANGSVYIGSDDGNLYSLNASTGALQWSYAAGSNAYYCSPAVANGVVYGGAYNSSVYALDASTGALLWSNDALTEASPTVANGVLYVGTGFGEYEAFNLPQGPQATSKRPDLKQLHPNLTLAVSTATK
jgi:outer membrane protein assembly factor BamB